MGSCSGCKRAGKQDRPERGRGWTDGALLTPASLDRLGSAEAGMVLQSRPELRIQGSRPVSTSYWMRASPATGL